MLVALLFTSPAVPQDAATVTSPGPASVAVTVYRGADATAGLNLDWLGGYALVTETRTLRLPAGPATVRFDGVAGGIVPASALVTGLPGGVIEKNRDDRLLSPSALVDGSLGRRVTLTRTDRATGRVRVQPAVIVAGPSGGVVVRTPDGVEALGCSGLPESTRYPAVPAGLGAGPVLSVRTASPRATTATVTLAYLTSEFDWRASYVATIAPDGRHLDLSATLTLANGNAESFRAAQVFAVAGRANHRDQRFRPVVRPLRLDCYPLGTTTSTLPPAREFEQEDARERIVVTGSVVPPPLMMMAPAPVAPPPPPPPEDLGDLKLYRVPERVTVASHAQKQVALLAAAGVPFERVYRATLPPAAAVARRATAIALRLRNDAGGGLGQPLPAGGTTLYVTRAGQRLLLGTGTLPDKAVGESVRLAAGISAQVQVEQAAFSARTGALHATNANPFPVAIEIGLAAPPANIVADTPFPLVDGRPTWVATIPAHGEARVTYRVGG